MILVTGIKGFIGSHIYSYFKGKGYEVHGTDTDIRIMDALHPHFRNAEFVIHAAGKVKKGVANPKIYHSINVLGTRNVCILCIENNAKLIHLSSIAGPTGEDETVRLYGASKQESQKLVEKYTKLYGLKSVILRLGVIYSKENNTGRPGARYPIEKLNADIEDIIMNHDFNQFELKDYSNIRV